jgi:hypothetical protein
MRQACLTSEVNLHNQNQVFQTMKKYTLLLVFICGMVLPIAAQEEETDTYEIQTLVSGKNVVGGYGALSMRYAELQNRDAFVFGARGGITIGHMFTLGLGGAGFFNDKHFDAVTNTDISLAGGYGGFFFEPVLLPKLPVNVAFPILIGAGGVGIMSTNNDENNWEDFKSEASDAFMVIEPGIEIQLNVTRFFRFCMGAYYRYTTDVDVENPDYNIPSDILCGFSGGVTFKFGRF